MLHEILLALSGHPSPLLRNDYSSPGSASLLSPPERELLSTAGHLSDLHCKLIGYTAQISASHSSVICRAVSTAISSIHLGAFQRKVLQVEDSILRKDAALVGAYDIVPLTAVIGEFSGWTHRLEWLWDLVQFMYREDKEAPCPAAKLIDKLRSELQTGYADIRETALSLVRVAETAWLKQVSAWVLYGRIPVLGDTDFFVRKAEAGGQTYSIEPSLLPSFVMPSTAVSMLFIGASLNRVRTRGGIDPSDTGLGHLPSQLQELSRLTFPLNPAMFSRSITAIRLTLSRTVLQKLLPLAKVLEMLRILRGFFLLGRGEFAMALTQQADEKIRSRWRRADNIAYQKRDGLGTVVVKEGEVAAVLARTWAALGSMQGQHADEDEELELARDLLQLSLSKSQQVPPASGDNDDGQRTASSIASTPFRNLLFSVPVVLTLQILSPLDIFLSPSDLQIYTSVNSYLLSIHRAHLRLTDLWKITSLRRHHPPPPRPPYSCTRGGVARTKLLRDRWATRSSIMRSTWSTSSAAIFFLSETEAYLQVEIVEGLWDGFYSWLTGKDESSGQKPNHPSASRNMLGTRSSNSMQNDNRFPGTSPFSPLSQTHQQSPRPHSHDPQTLATAHRLYLRTLVRRLLLTQQIFTDPLYDLLVHVDHLVALVHRLHGVWTAMDLETDEGVVDAFSNLDAEEADVRAGLRDVEAKVKRGIEEVIGVLRSLSVDTAFLASLEDGLDGRGTDDADDAAGTDDVDEEEGRYVPRRVGGVDRLLMKLDFGGWFGSGGGGGGNRGEDNVMY
ncbi:Spc98 family-domain-containing protein [Biscogniauxia mediterranea]|nr:Spc98 family-domain-containing protein [Biscogniauxia mediterranea]